MCLGVQKVICCFYALLSLFFFFSATTWHLAIHLSFSQWRSGQNGAIQPSQLNTLLLTDRCLKCNRSHKAVVEVLTFKSQLHAETWHVVSMYNFQFHRTFLLVLPVDFVLPSSFCFLLTLQELFLGGLCPLLPDTALCDSWGVLAGRDLSLHKCVHMHTHIEMLDNSITESCHRPIYYSLKIWKVFRLI